MIEKTLVQAGSAGAAGVLAQYAEKSALFGATLSGGMVASAGIAALAYFLAPQARGSMVNAASGAIDGAATWLALKYVAPAIGVQARPAMTYAVSQPRAIAPFIQRVEI